MSAAMAAGGASDSGKDRVGRGPDQPASAPSRKIPSARTFSQLAGRPARHGPQMPHFGSGSTVTRWPTAGRRRSPDGPDAADELVAHHDAGVRLGDRAGR
jgi:hypothetical protein